MNRTIRRILFAGFVFFFLLSAAVLLIYASGYRYHFGKYHIEKTGQLLVETRPKGARILMNGVEVQRQWSDERMTSPATVPYLFSGTYRLTVSRQGFHDWSGDITIYPGRTTIKNDILLVKNSAPVLLKSGKHIRAAQKRGDSIMVDDGGAVRVLNMRIEQISTLYTSRIPADELEAAPSGTRFVANYGGEWRVVEYGAISLTVKDTKKNPLAFRWAPSEDVLYMRDDKGIAVFDKEKKKIVPLVAVPRAIDFLVDDELVVLRGGTRQGIVFFDRRTGAQIRELSSIPPATRIWGSAKGVLILQGADNSLYLFDRKGDRPVFQHVADAQGIAFLGDTHFYTYNDFEVWSHDFSKDRYARSLVTRQSKRLSAMLPLADIPFVITVSGGTDIRMRDIRPKDTSSAEIVLASFTSIEAVFLNAKETALIVFGARDGQEGIFSLPIIEREELFPLVK
ncbi:PEGA domain-containing protein [Candidatus Uhrbacteria bacterium]|nr:PEGA domain-containing protein [Candidatus Uhrbacteria bacterium]